jgi:hypothetical protein
MSVEVIDTADVKGLRKLARDGRKAFMASPLSRFVVKMREVMADYLNAREAGVSRDDAVRGIEAVLREEWPQRVSKFEHCGACDGTGWRMTECVHGMRCSRYRCGIAESSWFHTYAVPCDCASGDKHRKRLVQVDDLAAAGKTRRKKPSGFTRTGG